MKLSSHYRRSFSWPTIHNFNKSFFSIDYSLKFEDINLLRIPSFKGGVSNSGTSSLHTEYEKKIHESNVWGGWLFWGLFIVHVGLSRCFYCCSLFYLFSWFKNTGIGIIIYSSPNYDCYSNLYFNSRRRS